MRRKKTANQNKKNKESKKMSNKMGFGGGFFQKGMVFSLEAIIALTLFALILLSIPQPQTTTLKELLITQQENDLLRVWSAKETNTQEMIQDTKKLFGENAELYLNGTKLCSAEKKTNSISTEGTIVDAFLNENKIRIIVHYD